MHADHMKLLNWAQALDQAKDPPGAAEAYRAFLKLEPLRIDAWSDYVGQLMALGQFKEAQKACENVLTIDPKNPSLRINLGAALLRQDRPVEAEVQFRSVLEVEPHRIDAQLFLAEWLLNKRDLVGVQKVLDRANQPGAMVGRYAELQLSHVHLWALFGSALLEARKYIEAEVACNTVLQLDPGNLLASSNLGFIWMAQGHFEKATELYRQLVNDHPHYAEIRLLLITCLARSAEIGLVKQEIAKVIKQEPTSFLVHKLVARTYSIHGCWNDYRAEIDRYLKVDPSLPYLDFERSLVDLLFGDMPQGWERYEARLDASKELGQEERVFAQPAWTGDYFSGKTFLLWAEQGLGDALMFVRYLPRVKALGGRVILETWPAVLGVIATCQGADLVIPRGAPLPAFDLQASLLSLPWIFGTELGSIPAEIPYLNVPREIPNRQRLLTYLALAENCTRIGLVWAGNPLHVKDEERSLRAAILAPLAVIPGVAWFGLQLDNQELPPVPNFISLAPYLKTFSDKAYALSGMDLLITVDTAVAHLAGAMGIPTFLLLPFQPDFRWLLGREDSPWYPSMRLYRQPAYGDWGTAIQQVVVDLSTNS